MSHWQNRSEPAWAGFEFNQPYAKGLKRLREDVLAKTDFDPATLWQWGTMQAMAVIGILKRCEREFGQRGQEVVAQALYDVGHDIGEQILAGTTKPAGMTATEFVSFYASVINRIAYASLEAPQIDGPDQASFDILWCPHQDHYQAFDCRVQRYFVEGMVAAAREFAADAGFDVRFDSTIPAGAPTCHFTMWLRNETTADDEGVPAHGTAIGDERTAWQQMTAAIDAKALEIAAREKRSATTG